MVGLVEGEVVGIEVIGEEVGKWVLLHSTRHELVSAKLVVHSVISRKSSSLVREIKRPKLVERNTHFNSLFKTSCSSLTWSAFIQTFSPIAVVCRE